MFNIFFYYSNGSIKVKPAADFSYDKESLTFSFNTEAKPHTFSTYQHHYEMVEQSITCIEKIEVFLGDKIAFTIVYEESIGNYMTVTERTTLESI